MAFHMNGYSNFHDDNQDWIISKIKNIDDAETHTGELAEAAQASADASQASAEASQASADASQLSAKASQLSAEASQASAENAAESEANAKNYADNIADPVSGLVTTWLSDHITNPSNPPIDTSLTVAGAAADAKAAGDMIRLNTDGYILNTQEHTANVNANNTYVINYPLYKGILYSIENNSNDTLTSMYVIKQDDTTEQISNGLRANGAIMIKPSENYKGLRGWSPGSGEVKIKTLTSDVNNKNLVNVLDLSKYLAWETGSIYQENGRNYNDPKYAARTPDNKIVYVENDAAVYTNDENIKTVYAFKYDKPGVGGYQFIERLGVLNYKFVNIDGGYYYRFAIYDNDTSIVIDDPEDFSKNTKLQGSDLATLLFKNIEGITGTLVTSSLQPETVKLERVGNGLLTYHQSFLIYNGHFYSTDGSNIAEQDEDFTIIRDVAATVGHGNSFQKGKTNLGYISGWDDNKIYVVNLDTLSVTQVINLPTTGYTTCAIDEDNSIAYIFQRDSRPNTEEIYNVIAYDYSTETILKTHRTANKFGAMQSCDFYKGRIIVASGLGTSTLPTDIIVYNTNGEITDNYVLPYFENTELEGVYYDNENHVIYISSVGKQVYTITH